MVGSGLTGVGLTGVGLTGVDLTGVDLTGVDLTGVDLPGVDPTNLDLAGFDPASLDLAGVDSAGGDLSVDGQVAGWWLDSAGGAEDWFGDVPAAVDPSVTDTAVVPDAVLGRSGLGDGGVPDVAVTDPNAVPGAGWNTRSDAPDPGGLGEAGSGAVWGSEQAGSVVPGVVGSDLTGVDLTGVDLPGVDPTNLDLAGFDPASLDLAGVDSAGGDLSVDGQVAGWWLDSAGGAEDWFGDVPAGDLVDAGGRAAVGGEPLVPGWVRERIVGWRRQPGGPGTLLDFLLDLRWDDGQGRDLQLLLDQDDHGHFVHPGAGELVEAWVQGLRWQTNEADGYAHTRWSVAELSGGLVGSDTVLTWWREVVPPVVPVGEWERIVGWRPQSGGLGTLREFLLDHRWDDGQGRDLQLPLARDRGGRFVCPVTRDLVAAWVRGLLLEGFTHTQVKKLSGKLAGRDFVQRASLVQREVVSAVEVQPGVPPSGSWLDIGEHGGTSETGSDVRAERKRQAAFGSGRDPLEPVAKRVRPDSAAAVEAGSGAALGSERAGSSLGEGMPEHSVVQGAPSRGHGAALSDDDIARLSPVGLDYPASAGHPFAGKPAGMPTDTWSGLATRSKAVSEPAIHFDSVSLLRARRYIKSEFPHLLSVNSANFLWYDHFPGELRSTLRDWYHGHLSDSGPNVNCSECIAATDKAMDNIAAKAPWVAQPRNTATAIRNYFHTTAWNLFYSWDDVIRHMKKAQVGARALVYVERTKPIAHVFNVINRPEGVVFLDGQTGKLGKLSPDATKIVLVEYSGRKLEHPDADHQLPDEGGLFSGLTSAATPGKTTQPDRNDAGTSISSGLKPAGNNAGSTAYPAVAVVSSEGMPAATLPDTRPQRTRSVQPVPPPSTAVDAPPPGSLTGPGTVVLERDSPLPGPGTAPPASQAPATGEAVLMDVQASAVPWVNDRGDQVGVSFPVHPQVAVSPDATRALAPSRSVWPLFSRLGARTGVFFSSRPPINPESNGWLLVDGSGKRAGAAFPTNTPPPPAEKPLPGKTETAWPPLATSGDAWVGTHFSSTLFPSGASRQERRPSDTSSGGMSPVFDTVPDKDR
ncbi:pentapeptide repeat-containing protein [Saccharopolyspora elongata]|uniref:pentapeptide repeat-containing protein n=1 Tax=Saccharopolyspora elongata TaxID=2530387 RepID=UPI0038B4BB11